MLVIHSLAMDEMDVINATIIAVDMAAGGLDDDSFLTACHGDATHESIATLAVPLL